MLLLLSWPGSQWPSLLLPTYCLQVDLKAGGGVVTSCASTAGPVPTSVAPTCQGCSTSLRLFPYLMDEGNKLRCVRFFPFEEEMIHGQFLARG